MLPRAASTCPNMNHKRADAPVSHCPNCGGVVNAKVRAAPCREVDHADARRRQTDFCVNCGEQLIFRR